MPQSVAIDIAGQRFGRLTFIERAGTTTGKRKKATWLCRCDCGGEIIAEGSNLRNGNTQTCRCSKREGTAKKRGMKGSSKRRSPTFQSWLAMHDRCTLASHVAYHRYGGRGITVCERWHDFNNFLEDMGDRPEGRTLDRWDNDRGYELGNCRWATPKEQAANRRRGVQNLCSS